MQEPTPPSPPAGNRETTAAEDRPRSPSTGLETPFLITTEGGSRTLVSALAASLRSVRHYLLNAVRDLDSSQLDERPEGCENSIGMLLSHVNAAEVMMRNITFEGRQFAEDEEESRQAFRLERNPLEGSDWHAYRKLLLATHGESLARLATRDDEWLNGRTTFFGSPSNRHYYWLHLIQDEARHTGQIILMRKHLLSGADPEFNPYLP